MFTLTNTDQIQTLQNDEIAEADRAHSPGYKAAMKAWSRFRFVRAGWFTPAEAIEYID
jgi:hypothetical protein